VSTLKVRLMSNEDFDKMSRSVKIDPKKLYDMTIDILHPRWTKHKYWLNEVRFIYSPANVTSGEFEFDANGNAAMVINFARIRTYRDLVYTIYHEWRHAYQLQKFGFNSFYSMSYNLEKNYNDSFMENDADQYAFWLEDKLSYKNFVINKNCPYSIFVMRKTSFKAVF
jgi:hypothetical protein